MFSRPGTSRCTSAVGDFAVRTRPAGRWSSAASQRTCSGASRMDAGSSPSTLPGGRRWLARPEDMTLLLDRAIHVKTQYYTAASLDGFIATADDSLEWLFPLGDIEATSYPKFIRDVGALAMGSATYEWMLRHVVGPEARPAQ